MHKNRFARPLQAVDAGPPQLRLRTHRHIDRFAGSSAETCSGMRHDITRVSIGIAQAEGPIMTASVSSLAVRERRPYGLHPGKNTF